MKRKEKEQYSNVEGHEVLWERYSGESPLPGVASDLLLWYRFGTKMLDIFRGLKSLIKISHIHIDSAVFRLHYSLTVILLIAFSLIVTTRQYVGNPIDCIHSKDLPEDVLNTYCWIHSTYTITAAYRKRGGIEVPFLGVDNSKSYPESERKEYRYYQWVCFMLFLQVIDRTLIYAAFFVQRSRLRLLAANLLLIKYARRILNLI